SFGADAPTATAGFERAVGVLALGGLAVAVFVSPPAWTVSGALVLAIFQNHWHSLGVGLSLDRYVLLAAILATLLHEWRRRDGRLQTRPVDWMLVLLAVYALVS